MCLVHDIGQGKWNVWTRPDLKNNIANGESTEISGKKYCSNPLFIKP